jgi:hypothetical protein
MNPDIVKEGVMQAACILTAATISKVTPANAIPIDATLQNADFRNLNVMAYETAKSFYAVLVQAFKDESGIWPDPESMVMPVPGKNQPGPAAGIVNALAGLTPGTPAALALAQIVQSLSALIPTAGQVIANNPPATPVSNPVPVVPPLGSQVAGS